MAFTVPRQGASCSQRLAQVPERFAKNHVKTRMCSFFLHKKCLRGSSCKFAHNESELRSAPDYSKTRLCHVYLQTGECPNGESCSFAHSQEELRVRETRRLAQQSAGAPPSDATIGRSPVQVEEAQKAVDAPLSTTIAANPMPGDDVDFDEDDDDDEPVVTKNLTTSTACTLASGGTRRSWADVTEDSVQEDNDDDNVDDLSEMWISTHAATLSEGCVSTLSQLCSETWLGAHTLDRHQVRFPGSEEEEEEENHEFEVQYTTKNSFFHLQPASEPKRRTRSFSAPAGARRA